MGLNYLDEDDNSFINARRLCLNTSTWLHARPYLMRRTHSSITADKRQERRRRGRWVLESLTSSVLMQCHWQYTCSGRGVEPACTCAIFVRRAELPLSAGMSMLGLQRACPPSMKSTTGADDLDHCGNGNGSLNRVSTPLAPIPQTRRVAVAELRLSDGEGYRKAGMCSFSDCFMYSMDLQRTKGHVDDGVC